MKPLVTPTVNLNGSSAESLINDRLQAAHLLDQAIETMQRGTPHGRDYQTMDRGTDREAREAWADRINLLREVRIELRADAKAIHDQIDWETRRAKVR